MDVLEAQQGEVSRRDMHEHLKTLWQTFGIVSALIVSACMSALNSDVSNLTPRAQRWYGGLWSACLMLNIDAFGFSIAGLGFVLSRYTNAEVERDFSWDRAERGLFWKTMLPSLFTTIGALVFMAASIMTTFQKFGRLVGGVACGIGVPSMVFGALVFVLVTTETDPTRHLG